MLKAQSKPLTAKVPLQLRTETLRRLTAEQLAGVQGGTASTIQPIQKPGH